MQQAFDKMYKLKTALKNKIPETATESQYTKQTSEGIVSELMWRHDVAPFNTSNHEELFTTQDMIQLKTQLGDLKLKHGTVLFHETDFDFANDYKLTTETQVYRTANRVIQRKIASTPYTSLKAQFIDKACCVVFVTENSRSQEVVKVLKQAAKSREAIFEVNITELTESQKRELRPYGELPIIFIGENQIKYDELMKLSQDTNTAIYTQTTNCTKSTW